MTVISLRKALGRRLTTTEQWARDRRVKRAQRLNKRAMPPKSLDSALEERIRAGRTPYIMERLKKD